MDLIASFIAKAAKNPKIIVFPEGEDERILQAAVRSRDLGIARPVLLGAPDQVRALADAKGLSLEAVEIIAPKESPLLAGFAETYALERGLKQSIAQNVVRKPLSFGGMMVRAAKADGMVGGVSSATASVIQAAALTVGYQPGISTPSSIFIMVIPEFNGEKDKVLVFADCAVTVNPDSRQLAEIGIVSARNARTLLGIDPHVAFLSFSTKGSGQHADVEKVAKAVESARSLAPDLHIDGELQGDAALVARVADKKAPGSPVAGKANVLIFPDLDAGNIAYKLVQYLGHAQAIGPFMQGFARPVNDLSRGASVDDVVAVTAITVVQAGAA